VQVHAEGLQISHSRRLLRVPAQQPHRLEIEAFTGGGQGVQVIGVRAARG